VTEDLQLKEQKYVDPRPKELFDRYHESARAKQPDMIYETTRLIVSPYMYVMLRCRQIGVENVPGSGGVILAPNHFSFLDHFLIGCFIRRRIRFMAKSQLFRKPIDWWFRHGGAFPVRRGAGDEEVFTTSNMILRQGGALCMYCEGGRSRTGKMAEKARPGIGRIALETGAPIVPIAIYGSSKVRNWKRMQFPRVTVQYGEPMVWEAIEHPSREQQQVVADAVLAEIRGMYDGLAREGRKAVKRRYREQRRSDGPAVA
jgi:1-acyl-sn-glycerol-3-phosphate acyltransferase